MNPWILGARPRTLPAAIAPVVVASAMAADKFTPIPAILALIVSLALQIGVNYANDYSDGIRGTDTHRVGPTRITGSGLVAPIKVKRAAFIAFGFAAVAGLSLAALSSWWLIAIGGFAIISAWGYTGGKNPYGYIGLGEFFVFIFFGVVATIGSYFVQTSEINLPIFLASISMGAFACALLAINNIRDRALDATVGKRTLAVRLGDTRSRNFFALLLAIGYLAGFAAAFPWALATAITAPLALTLIRGVRSSHQGADLIPYLAQTGKLQLLYSVIFAAAILIGRL